MERSRLGSEGDLTNRFPSDAIRPLPSLIRRAGKWKAGWRRSHTAESDMWCVCVSVPFRQRYVSVGMPRSACRIVAAIATRDLDGRGMLGRDGWGCVG
ncbi:hypothetical protein FRACA_410042 [Frankia canadensis]|uniref:Uncharacterized protein n=1 Tax=Frankia canadensis TaxID=1836972 RepID=A0A2I2KWZ0_9ACTN|nr:hypothetical protein FRACA_410042 [Frankia canadensis]SOU57458.1 hypothetical protein FRACA_410042 [Frankia canadensis]